MIRVMLVDDQAMVRTGFRMILEAEPGITVVGEAVDGRDAVEMVDRARPGCDPDGCADAEHGRHRSLWIGSAPAITTARVMMLTTFDLDDYVHAALRAGASGFLLKDAPPEQLIDAIRVVAAGDALLAPSVTQILIDEIARRPVGQPEAFPGIHELTERESDVIRLMARGLSNGEIAGELFLGEATVKTHVGRILAKLGARDRVQAVVAAYESGLVVPGGD